MKKIYTYVHQRGNSILSRGYFEDGSRFDHKEVFKPSLFVHKPGATKWVDLNGRPLHEVVFDSIKEARDYIESYKDVAGMEVLGMTNWITQYISAMYPSEIKMSSKYTRVFTIDIETTTENGFPDKIKADEEILLITLHDSLHDRFMVYTSREVDIDSVSDILRDNKVDRNKVVITKSIDELNLLKTFIVDWQLNYPDVLTDWNGEFFDVPYLVARIRRVLGESFVDKLSPWGIVNERVIKNMYGDDITYDIVGVNHLDYIALMKKYTYGGRESWKLDDIALSELNMRKLEYNGSFKEHYTNDFSHFTAYNICDVSLVKLLDKKLKLIDLALTIAYDSKIVPDEVFSQIRSWDSLIYNELKQKNIVIPNAKRNERQAFEGAFVKDPIVGKHKWIVSFDLQSLYPHIMMWANISPETMIQDYRKDVSVGDLLQQKIDNSDLVEKNYSMTANGICYRKDKQGFLVDIVTRIYEDRSKFKKQMLKLEQEYANTKNEELVPEISRLNNLQLARKIQINSVYGAIGSPFFRYFDIRIAEGITTSGQLAIRWVSNALNLFINKACGTVDVDYQTAGDTDSCYFTLEKLVEKTQSGKTTQEIVQFIDKFASNILQKVINDSYEKLKQYMNSYQQKLIMKREVIAEVGIYVAKKRYALYVHNSEGVQYAEPKIKVVGLELVRSSTPGMVKDYLKEALKKCLISDERELQRYVSSVKKEFVNKPYKDISFPRGVNGLSAYADNASIYKKGCPIHVRGALLFNEQIRRKKKEGVYQTIRDGDKIRFVALKMPNPIHENVIAFIDVIPPEFGLDRFIDYKTQFEKAFVAPLENILEAIGWEAEEKIKLDFD